MRRRRHPAQRLLGPLFAAVCVVAVGPVAIWCAAQAPRPVRWAAWRRRRAAGRDGRR